MTSQIITSSSRGTYSRRRTLAILGGSIAGAAVAGSSFAQQPMRGRTLRVSTVANPSSLDPATGGSGFDHVYLYTIYDCLIDWEYETLKLKPGLAESWSYPDPTTLVLNVRKDVVFHDGTPCDAAAVKFNLERNRSHPRSNVKADLASIASIEVAEPLKVVIKLKAPDTALPGGLSDRSGMMVSPKSLDGDANVDRAPVGTGAYQFVSWGDGERVVVKRNEKYWKPNRPYPDGIEFSIITEITTGLRSVVGGQNDFMYGLPARQQAIAERSGSLQVVSGSTLSCTQFYLNWARPPFNDVRVRRALNFAVDRNAFSKAAFAGLAEPAYMTLPKSHWAYDPSLVSLYPYDPDTARKLLADAGYASGLDVEFVGATDQDSVQREEVLIEMLNKVGIRIKFANGPPGTYSSQYFGPEKKGAGLLAGWSGRPDPSQTYASLFTKDTYYNAGRADVPDALVAALHESQASEDLAQRKKALGTVQTIVMENALVVPLVFPPQISVATKNVKDYKANLLGKPRFDDVWLSGS